MRRGALHGARKAATVRYRSSFQPSLQHSDLRLSRPCAHIRTRATMRSTLMQTTGRSKSATRWRR